MIYKMLKHPLPTEQVLNCVPFKRVFEKGPEDLAKAYKKSLIDVLGSFPRETYIHPIDNKGSLQY